MRLVTSSPDLFCTVGERGVPYKQPQNPDGDYFRKDEPSHSRLIFVLGGYWGDLGWWWLGGDYFRNESSHSILITLQILCIGTDRSQQTVQTKIRLLLKKQSDQGLRCLPFHQHLLDALMQCYIKLFYF